MARRPHSGVTDQRKAGIHRLEDAQVLFQNGRWRGAMYLAGYAVECRIKYKLMRRWNCFNLLELERRFAERGIAEAPFTHNLEILLRAANATDRLKQNERVWQKFTHVVNFWEPAWRYSSNPASERAAREFLEAVEMTVRWIENNL
jgi:HEPN domain-containing protein